jgi:hypothetical protein
MADYHEQVLRLWDEWVAETGQPSGAGNPADFIDWAVAAKKLAPRPQDIKRILREQVTRELRKARRFDIEGGFTYRAKQCVTLFDGGVATKHYFDTDTGGTPTLRQKATKQRRDAIAHSVYRGACDVERMNKVFPDDPQLNFFTDFTDDVAELRAAEMRSDDEEDDNDDCVA